MLNKLKVVSSKLIFDFGNTRKLLSTFDITFIIWEKLFNQTGYIAHSLFHLPVHSFFVFNLIIVLLSVLYILFSEM